MDAKAVFRFILIVTLILTVILWSIVVIQIALWPVPETDAKPFPLNGNWFYTSAGTLLTAIGAGTATAIGFEAGTQKPGFVGSNMSTAAKLRAVAGELDVVVIVTAVAYVLIGFAVAGVAAFAPSEKAVQALTVYGTASVGWLVGAVAAAAAGLKQN